jgi:sugar phosphate isomerase/epimerase
MTLEFACHTGGFNDRPLLAALGTVARLGFRYVDLATGPHLDIRQVASDPRGAAARIRQVLGHLHLTLSDVHLMLPHITLKDDTRRRKAIDHFKASLPFLVALETPGVTLSPGMAPPGDDEAAGRAVDALQEMVSAAKAATPATRLDVSIEPHLDSIAPTPGAALALIEQVDGLSLTLDWAHMICQGVPHDDIAGLLPHTRHVQLRQAAPGQLQVSFEGGQLEPARVVAALQAAAYSGVVSMEYMLTEGWHGTIRLPVEPEASRLRDALRAARDAHTTARDK